MASSGMAASGVSAVRSFDRRRSRRVQLAVPVQFGRHGPAEGPPVRPHAGWSMDVSPTGLYLTTGSEEVFASGDVLTVSVTIPWEARRMFPFSRMVGSGRIVRVEDVPAVPGTKRGLALSFCEGGMTLLGAILTP